MGLECNSNMKEPKQTISLLADHETNWSKDIRFPERDILKRDTVNIGPPLLSNLTRPNESHFPCFLERPDGQCFRVLIRAMFPDARMAIADSSNVARVGILIELSHHTFLDNNMLFRANNPHHHCYPTDAGDTVNLKLDLVHTHQLTPPFATRLACHSSSFPPSPHLTKRREQQNA
jgi:hypothetical protein